MPRESERQTLGDTADGGATPCCTEGTRDGAEHTPTHGKPLSSQPGLPSSWFDFGRNWLEFSRRAITPEKVHQEIRRKLKLPRI